MGRLGIGRTKIGRGVAASIAMGCAGAKPESKARTVADGTTVREPESLAQHIPSIESPSDTQQSSAVIWAPTRQGHRAKTRLHTVTANRQGRSRRRTAVTPPCITSRPNVARMQLSHRTWPASRQGSRVDSSHGSGKGARKRDPFSTECIPRKRANDFEGQTNGRPQTRGSPAVRLLGRLRLLRAGAVFPAIALAALVASTGCFATRFAFHRVVSPRTG